MGLRDASGGSDGAIRDANSGGGGADAGPRSDSGPVDTGIDPADAGGPGDASTMDSGADLDAGAPDLGGPLDVGPPDSGVVDAGPPPVTCTEPGLVTQTIPDSASSGTPDTYFFDVNPGDPFCAQITGGGSGRWGVTVSNGTSSGIYCSNTTPCRVRVAAGDPTLLVTAQTTDIGFYTLTVQSIPRP